MEVDSRIIEMIDTVEKLLTEHNKDIFTSGLLGNLSVNQFMYLDAISRFKDATISELAREMNLAKPTVTNAVNFLVAGGYIDKVQSSGDKRVFYIRLNRKGVKVIEAHKQIHKRVAEEIMNPLTQDEAAVLLSLFEKITTGLADNKHFSGGSDNGITF